MATKVVISPAASSDIQEIVEYVAQEAPAAAARLRKTLRQRCLTLARQPELGRRYDNRFRVLVEGQYLIFYRLDGVGNKRTVVISIVVHGARDFGRLLEAR